MNTDASENKKLSAIFTLVLLAILGITIGTLLSIAASGIIGPLMSDSAAWIRLTQVISSISTFLVPALLMPRFLNPKPKYRDFLSINKPMRLRECLLTCLITLSMLPINVLLGQWNRSLIDLSAFDSIRPYLDQMEERMNQVVSLVLVTDPTLDIYIINLFVVAVTAAVTEEFFFRGAMQGILTHPDRSPFITILITSTIFSIFHLQFYGFITRLIIGMVLGYIVFLSGNIWHAILAHALNNAVAMTLMSFSRFESLPFVSEGYDSTYPPHLYAVSALSAITLLWSMRKLGQSENRHTQ